MSTKWRRLVSSYLFATSASLLSGVAAAQPVCNGTTERLMSWPDVNPVWEFCWLRPQDSTPVANGSGLEIRDVYYNGHKVMERGHVPILNVEYNAGAICVCYRDWSDQERVFQADNVVSPGYAEPTAPPVTVCENGGVDIGSFVGVAAEKLADRLILTTQVEAGWYRYTMKWRFFLDGTIEPFFGFAAVCNPCVSCSHRHHVYWRFDFDIDGPANDVVTEGPNPSGGGRSRPRYPTLNLPTEAMRMANKPAVTWSIADAGTHRGYRIVPGEETALPADTFAVADFWALRYKSNELDDGHLTCAAQLNNFVTGEGLADDAVLWYRGGSEHIGDPVLCASPSSDCEDGCETVGPTLVPFGDWAPSGGGH